MTFRTNRFAVLVPWVTLLVACAAGPDHEPTSAVPEAPPHHDRRATDAGASPSDAEPGTSAGDGDAGAATAARARSSEICGNGLDDDMNGIIDDTCACPGGSVQRCSFASETEVGVGACSWGMQSCSGGELGTWGSCTGFVLPAPESCDGIDNNCDGRIDEGCSCAVGDTRPCYDGPASTDGVGACRSGTQLCSAQSDGAGWGACNGETLPGIEACDGADRNCDGQVDEGCVCPAGQVPTYRRPATGGGSGILPPGTNLLQMTCEPGHCGPGQVAVANDPSMPGATSCVPSPPTCAGNEQIDFVGGALRCVPCEVIVQFGALYGGRRACATTPTLACPTGQVPTFVFETLAWECRPTCNNGTYDQHFLGGMLVCIPC